MVSLALAYFTVQFGMDYYREYAVVKSVDAEIQALREDARKNNPDQPEVIAVHDAAKKKTAENINAKTSVIEKQKTAAGNFIGFYLVNYRQRAEFCRDQGVDISPFIQAFAESHTDEYSMAVKAISAAASDVDKLYDMLKPQLVTVIEQDMTYIAKQNEVSLAEACQLISDNVSILMPDMHISVMQPVVYKALMAGS